MKTRYVGWLLCLILCPSLAAAQGMWIDKDAFVPGEAITVHFSAPGSYADNAWVGIIPSQVVHGREAENDRHDLSYQYLHKKTSGTLTFRAPTQAGAYDLRMHDTDSNGRETASVSFTVSH